RRDDADDPGDGQRGVQRDGERRDLHEPGERAGGGDGVRAAGGGDHGERADELLRGRQRDAGRGGGLRELPVEQRRDDADDPGDGQRGVQRDGERRDLHEPGERAGGGDGVRAAGGDDHGERADQLLRGRQRDAGRGGGLRELPVEQRRDDADDPGDGQRGV